MTEILRIVSAEVVGDHVLHVAFSNGVEKSVSLKPYLSGPVFEPLRDPDYFARVRLDTTCGTVVWPNGADLAPEALLDLDQLEMPASE